MEQGLQIGVSKGPLTMATKRTIPIYCKSCGAYLGEAVPGYLLVAQCFCGEVTAIPRVVKADIQAEDFSPQAIAS